MYSGTTQNPNAVIRLLQQQCDVDTVGARMPLHPREGGLRFIPACAKALSIGSAHVTTEHDPLFGIAATAVTTGRRDGSTDHDRYVYGSRRSRPGSSRRSAMTKTSA